jgi:hypothetical protein
MNAENEDTIRTAAQLWGNANFTSIPVTFEGPWAHFGAWSLYVPEDRQVSFDLVYRLLQKRTADQ